MSTFGQRLREARKAKGLSQAELGKMVGVKQPTIAEAEAEGKGSAKSGLMAKFLGVSASWLTEGRGPMYDNQASSTLAAYNSEPSPDEYTLVPQLDIGASCGDGRFSDHVVVKGGLAFKKSYLRKFGLTEENSRVIYADGNSNEPTIIDGCAVLISLIETSPIDGKFFLIVDPDGAVLLKRLVREYNDKSGGMAWIMRSDNPNKKDYPDKLLPDDERTKIVGRAVWNDNVL